ncbi:Nn.00g047810.m01.CDS01 [Neocucurbitaria sp. VM-36]
MKFTSTLLILSVAALSSARVLRVRQANAQTFNGALGGIEATPIVDSGNADRPFQVKDATFVNLGAALQRSCDQQFNACANAANGGTGDFSTQECQAQKDQCSAAGAGQAAKRYRFRI